MSDPTDFDLRNQLNSIGIVRIAEQDRVIDVARRCARTTGVVFAGTGAVIGAPGGPKTMLLGMLAGFAGGTVLCTALSYSAREQLREIARGHLDPLR